MNGYEIRERSEHHEKALLFPRSPVLLAQGSSQLLGEDITEDFENIL